MLIITTLCLLIVPVVRAQNWLLDYILPPDYNRDMMPIKDDVRHSIQVNVTLYINIFHGTDDELVN